ncbi:MAG: RNA polymerase-binding protein DksA [Gammaproteobacteria bacterium]|jgi:DnaK suppressor protein
MAKTSKQTKKRTATKSKTVKAKKPKKTVSRTKTASKKTKVAKKAKATKKTTKAKVTQAKKTAKKKVAPRKAAKPKKAKTKVVSAKPAKKPKKETPKPKAAIGIAVVDIAPYKPKKTEKYMSAKMREHFRAILVAWKQQLMEEVDRTVSHLQGEAANFPDPSDRATQEETFSLELRTRDRERKLIRKIEEALQMIDNDEYGYCTCCGEEIGLRRLEARPTAKLCIDCKTLDEIREKQEGI